ncbi:TIGR03086 family metal-binding protein [Nonomuraea sp. H19]|uniref:TIGR03086 family metal-binding protein n=1 Tax=Nonomuraea sp. H19 TaxID=3452206 RepID=UPI003F8B92DB
MHTDLASIAALDARAVQHSADLVRQVRRTDLDRPTPCAGWTLGDLLAHMTAQHRGFAAAAAGAGPDLAHWVVDPPGDDPVADYLRAAEAVIAAFADSPRSQFALPEISMAQPFPAATAVAFHFIDYVVHAWDVAAALGATYDPEPDLLAAALPVALAVPDGERRLAPGSAFRPALPVADEAGPLERVLAALGRAPDWNPGRLLTLPITTPRLLLRLFTADDLDDMVGYQGLASVARYLYRPPRTREECAGIIARVSTATAWAAAGDAVTLAVCRHTEPGVIGQVSLTLADDRARQAEIGWLLHPAHEGHGFATEAARALATAAFEQLGVHRLFARLDAENTGSARLCERLGMRREAHLVENDVDGERWGSEYVYAILAREFRRSADHAQLTGSRP